MQIHDGIFSQIQLFGLIEDKAFAVRMIPLLKPLFMKADE